MALTSANAFCASTRDFFIPPNFLSEKYLVKLVPARLMHKRQPSNAAVSYVNRVRFFFEFISGFFEQLDIPVLFLKIQAFLWV